MSAQVTTRDVQEAARALRTQWRTEQLLRAAARLMAREGFDGVSMQALADEADVSVGLIYRYFGGKDDVLLAVIVDVLNAFGRRVPAAIESAGDDPVEQVSAAFRAYCAVIDEHRHAAVLTYRESRTLSDAGLSRIKQLEVETSEPLRSAIAAALDSGLLLDVDPDVLTFDLLLLAHGWALKHWRLDHTLDLDAYVARQTSLVLGPVIAPEHQHAYRPLLRTGRRR